MIRLQNWLKKIDFNSQQFAFFIEKDQKKKQTEAGGAFSILVIIVSALYLSYLLSLFFGNEILPKITTQMQNKTTMLSQKFNKSIFGFTYMTQNLTSDQLQKQTGKIFLTYQLQKQIFKEGNYELIDLNFHDCQDDPNFQGYKCIDFSNQPESVKEIFTDPTNLNQSYYSLVVQPCQGLPNCASPQEIENYIMQNSFVFFFKIRVRQYNQNAQKIDETFLIDFFQFDQNLSIFHQYFLQQQVSTINEGYLIQDSNTTVDITSFRKSTSYYSQQNIMQKAGFTGFGQFFFGLDQIQIIQQIQFPLLTETLAQFLPILNILLALGFMARKFSESKIVKDINNIYLKDYYKQTAVKLIQKDNLNINKSQLTQAEYISHLQSIIDNTNFMSKPKAKQKKSIEQQQIGQQKNDKKIFNIIEHQKLKLVQDKTNRTLNVYEIYQDLIEIKTAIKLMMTPDQYAAMKFCGCDVTSNTDYQQCQFNLDFQQPIKEAKNEELKANQVDKVFPSIHKLQPLKNVNLEEGIISQRVSSILENKDKEQPSYEETKMILKQQEQGVFQNPTIDQKSLKTQNKSFFSENKKLFQAENHLQEIENMLQNKKFLDQQLQIFINKVKSQNKQLTQTDLNIYSSLIGQDYSTQN